MIGIALFGSAFAPQGGAPTPTVLSQYREVALGDSLQVVLDRLKLAPADVKVLHARPSQVEEITWRPHRFVSGTTLTHDPLAEAVLTFHSGRLARIVATYDRERTQGLTDADLHEILSGIYGVAMLPSTTTAPPPGLMAPRHTVAVWSDAATQVLLWRETYPTRVGLTIVSIAADAALQDAMARGDRLFADEAPQRDLDQRAAAAAAILQRDAQIRLENKAKFKP
jgi:hypothetical protein